MRKLIPIVFLFLLSIPADAADINAASCSQTDVQAAIDSASGAAWNQGGDQVIIPAGSCTWTTSVSIGVVQGITVQGAGMNSTLISCATGGSCFNIRATSSRVTGFRFTRISGDNLVRVDTRGQGWRIDNNRFESSNFRTGVLIQNSSTPATALSSGLIDNNEFVNCRVLHNGDLAGIVPGSNFWALPLDLGTDKSVYIEDNTFEMPSGGNVIDASRGGHFVFRYNTVSRRSADNHSVQSSTNRSAKSFEIYENTFNTPEPHFTAMFLRGGTGVVYNNTITGAYSNAILLDNRRSFENRGFPPGNCDGNSSWDGNESPPDNGWPCRDQIGRGQDAFEWTAQNPTPPQASEPAYFWNNTLNASPAVPKVVNSSGIHIQEGRDYFVGVVKPGYTPFTYPHPLVSGAVPRPEPPTNLGAVVQ